MVKMRGLQSVIATGVYRSNRGICEPMKLRDLIKQSTEAISQIYPEREAREMVLAYLCHVLGIQRHTHIIEPAFEVPSDRLSEILYAVERMASGEPLQYVTGEAHFYGRTFHVTPSVLIPRPETELLCRMALDSCPEKETKDAVSLFKVLDLCTGSGCIAWTMALEMPGAKVTAVDVSDSALSVASTQDFSEETARTGAVAPSFIKADVLSDDLPDVVSSSDVAAVISNEAEGKEEKSILRFDLLLSNPPYVMDKEKALMRTNVLEHEPHLALFVPDDDPLRFYKAIAHHSARLLSADGVGIVEINEALGIETASLFTEAGFTDVRIENDLNDRPRFVIFRR